jgi:hypothetical protein
LFAETEQTQLTMSRWEEVATRLREDGWKCGCIEALSADKVTVFIVDAHRGDDERFVALSDNKLSAFLELERTVQRAHSPPGSLNN